MTTIHFTNRQKHLRVNRHQIEKVLKSVLRQSGYKNCALSLVFVDNAEIRRINRRFLGRHRVTDVIAFPLGDSTDNLLGEIIVSAQEAVRQARRQKIPPTREFLLYCVHGLLHLLGYDDTTPQKRKKMWKKQEEILSSL